MTKEENYKNLSACKKKGSKKWQVRHFFAFDCVGVLSSANAMSLDYVQSANNFYTIWALTPKQCDNE